MIVLLYSDTNYVLEGFSAEYSVTDCPFNCSSHGHCVDHKCVCEAAYVGEACEFEACPDQCGFKESRGWCEKKNGLYQCQCNDGFIGLDCSLDMKSSTGNSWHLLSRAGGQRTAHGGVYLKDLNKFFSFGGFDLNDPLGDLLSFDLATLAWANLTEPNVTVEDVTEPSPIESALLTAPRPRYGHAMAPLGETSFVLYGGQLPDGSISGELFHYDAVRDRWTLLADRSLVRPPPLMRHTLSAVNDSLYVFGGGMVNGEFSSKLFRVRINSSGNLFSISTFSFSNNVLI